MEGFGWIMTVIIGGIAGWIAEKIMKSDMGLIGNIILGVIGAVILNAILIGLLERTLYGFWGQLLVAVIGACLVIFGWRLIRGRR
jgi:uncharacterized membrane protein YeaQ/YmgE (transglycosylase-associated protein family)